jgi:hypothetical protein
MNSLQNYTPLPIKIDNKHTYWLEGEEAPLIGTTTIIKSMAKDFLAPWASKEAVKHLGYFDQKQWDGKKMIDLPEVDIENGWRMLEEKWEKIKILNVKKFYDLLYEAKVAFTKKSGKAKDKGHDVHDLIENSIKTGKRFDINTLEDKEVQSGYKAWLDWEKTHKIEYLACELITGSKTLWTAGTIDAVAEVDGHLEVLDWKTNGQLSSDVYIQTAAYKFYLEENGVKFLKRRVVRLDKEKGIFEEEQITTNYEKDLECFKSLLNIYRWSRENK